MSPLRPLSSILYLLPIAWLWFHLINHLRVEWTLNPQYSYGWAVPFLCAYLVWKRVSVADWRLKTETGRKQIADVRPTPSAVWPLAVLGFLYLPTRLIEEANPEWRLISWALALLTIGLTLLVLRFALRALTVECGGSIPLSPARPAPPTQSANKPMHSKAPPIFNLPSSFQLSAFLFPLCYFLVAVPWPTFLEGPLIQALTRADMAVTIEILNGIGIAAIQHGNVIEIATGFVGIDEACSGIRSFQATLMISLFLGELYRLTAFRRTVLCFAGFAMSFVFNIGRASLLTWVAARDGIVAIAKWHDPAGIIILVGCFLGLWVIGVGMKTRNAEILKVEIGNPPRSTLPLRKLPFAFAVWLLLVEVGTELWYRAHEAKAAAPVVWTAAWPANNPTLKAIPMPEATRRILRYDVGENYSWKEDGLAWQAFFLNWNPGRTAVHLAQNHTPEVCLAAVGRRLLSASDIQSISVNGLRMPFRSFAVAEGGQNIYVFYCLWEDSSGERNFQTAILTYGNRLSPVLVGRRQRGQRSIELAVWGAADEQAAATALQHQLERLIQSGPGVK